MNLIASPRSATPADARFVDEYLPYLLARASHLVSSEFHDRLAEKGIQVPVWRLLATLHGTQGMTVGELARLMLYKQPTVSKVIDRLEAEGLVKRRAAEKDRRNVLVVLTRSGRTLVAGLIEEAERHQREVMASFTTKEADLLFRVLGGLILRLGGGREDGAPAPIPLPLRRSGPANLGC